MRLLRKLTTTLCNGRVQGLVGAIALASVLLLAYQGHGSPFTDKLQYELNNRAFALASMTKAVTKAAPSNALEFWQAYRSLEVLNQQKHRLIAEKYGLEPEQFVVMFKVHATELLISLFPDKMMEGLTTATAEYVGELKVLRELSPKEDRAFFDYAVAQEQAQAEALQHALAGRFDLGAEVLRVFVKANTELVSRIRQYAVPLTRPPFLLRSRPVNVVARCSNALV